MKRSALKGWKEKGSEKDPKTLLISFRRKAIFNFGSKSMKRYPGERGGVCTTGTGKGGKHHACLLKRGLISLKRGLISLHSPCFPRWFGNKECIWPQSQDYVSI